MKTTVEIADPLLEEAKQEAARGNVTLRELVELGLRRVLDDRARAKKRPFKLRDASIAGGELNPAIRLAEDGQPLRAYRYLGMAGSPDTVEGINAELDAEAAARRRAR